MNLRQLISHIRRLRKDARSSVPLNPKCIRVKFLRAVHSPRVPFLGTRHAPRFADSETIGETPKLDAPLSLAQARRGRSNSTPEFARHHLPSGPPWPHGAGSQEALSRPESCPNALPRKRSQDRLSFGVKGSHRAAQERNSWFNLVAFHAALCGRRRHTRRLDLGITDFEKLAKSLDREAQGSRHIMVRNVPH